MSSRRSRSRGTAPSEGEARRQSETVPAEPSESVVFLPLTAGDFHSGWAIDWSPDLRTSPLLTPLQHAKRRG
jgi:hypothetical protein